MAGIYFVDRDICQWYFLLLAQPEDVGRRRQEREHEFFAARTAHGKYLGAAKRTILIGGISPVDLGISDEAYCTSSAVGALFQSILLQIKIRYVFIQFLQPQVLQISALILVFRRSNDSIAGNIDFGNYNGYLTWPFQVVGVISAMLVFGIVFYGALDSKSLDFLIVDDDGNSTDSVNVELQGNPGLSDRQDPSRVASATNYSNMDDLEQSESPGGAAATPGATLA